MRHIISGLTLMLIPVIVNGLLACLRQPRQAERGKVYLPKFLAVIGLISSTIFLILTMITAFSGEALWIPIGFFLMSLLGMSLVVAFVNCRISYDEERFVAKSFLGIKREFTYDQVTAIKEGLHEDYIYIGKRRVMIDEISIGGVDFIILVKRKYRATHNGQSLPQIYKTKHDLFNGNVQDAGAFLLAFILITAISVGFLILLIVYTYFSPDTPENTVERDVCFVSCDVSADEIVLTSTDRQHYIIQFIDEPFDAEAIQGICDGNTLVTAYFIEHTPDDAEAWYSVKAIMREDTYLLSFEETNHLRTQEYQPIVIFLGGLCLIWVVYMVFNIYVGRNPRKFSKRFVLLFFKDGHIKY